MGLTGHICVNYRNEEGEFSWASFLFRIWLEFAKIQIQRNEISKALSSSFSLKRLLKYIELGSNVSLLTNVITNGKVNILGAVAKKKEKNFQKKIKV